MKTINFQKYLPTAINTLVFMLFCINYSCASMIKRPKLSAVKQGEICEFVDAERELCQAVIANDKTFELPDGTRSYFLELAVNNGIPSADQIIDLSYLKAPNSNANQNLNIYESTGSYLENINPRSLDPLTSIFTMMVPNHARPSQDALQFDPQNFGGKWEFELTNSFTNLQSKVLYRVGEPYTSGTLKVAIYLTGAKPKRSSRPWNKTEVTSGAPPEDYSEFVEQLKSLFCSYGINLVIDEVHDASPEGGAPATFNYIYVKGEDPFGSKPSFTELLKVMAPTAPELQHDDGVLRLALIQGTSPEPWIGWNWSPGPYSSQMVHGGMFVVIASKSPQSIASTVAHEIGHYLGLYHTIEDLDKNPDPIDDTSSEDVGNLMYFTKHKEALTEAQKKIMLSHPSIIPYRGGSSACQ